MKVAVTPAGFDNIKSVLENSQVDVEICDISLEELSKAEALEKYSVVFINCNGGIPGKVVSKLCIMLGGTVALFLVVHGSAARCHGHVAFPNSPRMNSISPLTPGVL